MRPRGLLRLALTGISGNPLRSWLVGGCALLVAGMVLSTVIISQGGEQSLRLARERLGADVVVVPRGSVTGIEGAPSLRKRIEVFTPAGVTHVVVMPEEVQVIIPGKPIVR